MEREMGISIFLKAWQQLEHSLDRPSPAPVLRVIIRSIPNNS